MRGFDALPPCSPVRSGYQRADAILTGTLAVKAQPRAAGGTMLRFLANADAFRRAPRAWLLAAWWRVTGKRLRARAQFAPLLAASSLAYDLWRRSETPPDITSQTEGPPIFALIAAGDGQARTLASVHAEGIEGIIVGGEDGLTPDAALRAAGMASGGWVMPLAPGDRLATGAVAAYRAAIAQTHSLIVYADDDGLDLRGRRERPHLKPNWNAELFKHFDYITGACVVRADAVRRLVPHGHGWHAVYAETALQTSAPPSHLPYILHHRPNRPFPQMPAPLPVLSRSEAPLVTVIVPTRNRSDLLRVCLLGVASTAYPHIEVIVVDNGSDEPETLEYLASLEAQGHRVLRDGGPFNFSRLNNRAVREARGALLCLLNNDVSMIGTDWLGIMASQALREDVGAVGAQLLYPDGRVQHAGVVLGIGGGAAHAHRLLSPDDEGYFRRHALPQFVSAVTAACLVVRRDRFLAVGGLNEDDFAVAFNDVDLCMRLNAAGWQSLYEPRAVLVHHESVSRGKDRDPQGKARLARELDVLQRHWQTDVAVDPFHHPRLSRYSERFALAVEEPAR